MPDAANQVPPNYRQALAKRELARRRFSYFIRYWAEASNVPLKWNWHLDYLGDVLQAVAQFDPEVRFLIINIPPRFAKSTLTGVLWPVWMIGRQNDQTSSLFSLASSGNLANRDSRKSLDIVRSDWYQALFPHVKVGSKETEAEWDTTGGAYRIASGAEGNVTGRGAHHLLVDDLVQAAEASSETVREKRNEWLGETLRSRLDDQMIGTITNIQQRLHERDATGHLMELSRTPGGDQYKQICLPNEAPSRTIIDFKGKTYATREAGDLLHPARIGRAEAAALKASMRNNYHGQYQQQPIKMEGGHLDPRRLVKLPHSALDLKSRYGLRPVFYMDFAATEKQTQKNDPDFNVILVGAKDQMQRLIILDIWRTQTADQGVVARTLINMRKLWRPHWIKGEKGSLINTFQPILREQQKLTGEFFTVTPLPGRVTDKVERSLSFQGALNAGMVCVPDGAPWLAAYEAELRGFPAGAHDDMVDTSSDFGNDAPNLPTGEAPYTDPGDERITLNKQYVKAINDAIANERNPPLDSEGW